MGMIGKIRKQSKLLVVVIALGMLLFLVPWNQFLALIGEGQYEDFGKVNGHSISRVEYDNQRNVRSTMFGSNVSAAQLNNSLWEDMQQRYILNDEYAKLGLDVNDEEWQEMIFGEYIPQSQKNLWYTKGVTEEAHQNWQASFDFWSSLDNEQRAIEYDGRVAVTKQVRLKEKWDNLVDRGIYYNTVDAKQSFRHNTNTINIDYVFVPFSEVADSLFSVDEGDLKSYYNRHKNDPEFFQDRECDIEYVEFAVTASAADSASVKEDLTRMATKWGTVEAGADSAFVIENGKAQFFRPSFVIPSDKLAAIDAQIASAQVGDVVGPLLPAAGADFRLVKVLDRRNEPDSAECRHILIGKEDPTALMADLRERADSIRKEIRAGGDWDELCAKHSTDPGSKDKGGVYEMFGRANQFVTPFSDACFQNRVGDMVLVETQYGIHLVEVTKQTAPVSITRYAEINKGVEASPATRDVVYNEARQFSFENGSGDKFAATVEEKGLPTKTATAIRPGNSTVAGLGVMGNLVNWVFKSDENAVSGVFSTGTGVKFIVARLDKKKEQGVAPFRYVEEAVREAYLKELKADYLLGKMGASQALNEIAEAVGSVVKKGNNINLSANTINGSGAGQQEYEAVGFALGLSVGQMSTPIVGESGVFIIAPSSDINIAADQDMYIEAQEALLSSAQSRAKSTNTKPSQFTGPYGSMKRKADVVDNRFRY